MRLPEAFRVQAASCASLSSPFMERLLLCLAEHMPQNTALFAKAEHWPDDDLGPSAASLPLRIAGGLHALVLQHADTDLMKVYPPNTTDDAALRIAVLAALKTHEAFLLNWIDRPPQTNEVRRCAPLIAAAHEIAARHPLPFAISELGASGGLNLMFDRFALEAGGQVFGPANAELRLTPHWFGALPKSADLSVIDRCGVDLTPLDARDPDDILRLYAYLWPDQPYRRALTKAALSVFDAQVESSDAIDWLGRRLTKVPGDCVHMIYHTVAWQYFPKERQATGQAMIEAAGARATDRAPLAWLSMEADGQGRGAGLRLRLWPGDLTLSLGRSDFHGRWVQWDAT